ncbi:MAG: CPBP family intramembrane glutamic endopeptidase [Pseudomonadota bacterium]
MEFFQSAGLSTAETILLIVILIGLPIECEIALRIYKPRIEAGVKRARLYTYFYSIASLWALAIAILAIWAAAGRDWAALGFQFEWTLPTMIACAAAAAVAGLFLVQLALVHVSGETRAAYRRAISEGGGGVYFLPRTEAEHRAFLAMGTTAGITEEIIFRGFLIWALSALMPLWLAAAISCAMFVFLHRYQGLAGLAQVAVAGGLLTGLYIASGSLYPVIALHIALDVLNGLIIRRAQREEGAALAA